MMLKCSTLIMQNKLMINATHLKFVFMLQMAPEILSDRLKYQSLWHVQGKKA